MKVLKVFFNISIITFFCLLFSCLTAQDSFAYAKEFQVYDSDVLNQEFHHTLDGNFNGEYMLGQAAGYKFAFDSETTFTLDFECENNKAMWLEIMNVEASEGWNEPRNNRIYFMDQLSLNRISSYHGELTLPKGSYGLRLMNLQGDNEGIINYTLKISVLDSEKIVLSEEQIDLKVGKTKTLKYEILPEGSYNDGLVWSSSNNKVATVTSNGKVEAVGFGKATITASLGTGVIAKCEVMVKEADIYLFKGDKKKIPNVNGKKRSEWKTKDKSVATSNSYVHGKGQGKTTLTKKIGGTTYKCNVYVTDLQKLKKKAINYTDGAKPTAYGYLNGRPVVEMETKYYHIFTGYYSYTYEYIRFTQKFKATCEDSFSTNDDCSVRLDGDKLTIYRDFGDETYTTEITNYKEF